ncbi:hypothetical protein FG379_000552 [Cryptosporidium bovis]|uniref:uncharacterized protein n=1 Tax=Cryptosporidium bovis TaxID=310047 RepID=UPI00351A6110|nr:hypothetical protein FG379_000552 [Cryptosporidium bovis]
MKNINYNVVGDKLLYNIKGSSKNENSNVKDDYDGNNSIRVINLENHVGKILSNCYDGECGSSNVGNTTKSINSLSRTLSQNSENFSRIEKNTIISTYKYNYHFLSMIKKGLICFSCGTLLKSNKLEIDIKSIQTCPSSSDVTSYNCSVDVCGRSVCHSCFQYSKSQNVLLYKSETSRCIICEYQLIYNKNNPQNQRNTAEWHWDFHTSDDLMFLRKIRGSLINGNGLHIELSDKRQGCWRRRKEGKRKHFSFKQHGGFFESRAVALEFSSVYIKSNNSERPSAPLMITAINDNYSNIVPKRIQKYYLNKQQKVIMSSLSDTSCIICFEKQNSGLEIKFIKCTSCGRTYCGACIQYIQFSNPKNEIAKNIFNKDIICVLCYHSNLKSTKDFATFIHEFQFILPSNTTLIKFDRFNMKWRTPYGSVSVLEAGGILESRKEAYIQLENGQNSEMTNYYDRNIFYGEFNNKVGYYTQFVKNGVLRIYGPFGTFDEAGRRWDLDTLKYYGAEKAMRKAFFPKLLTWLSLPQTLQRYFLAPWIIWSMEKEDKNKRLENKFNQVNKISKNYDIIIIGAGLSGLKSAEILLEKGLDVLILEAQTAPFGRISGYNKWVDHIRKVKKESCFFRENASNQEIPGEHTSALTEENINISNELVKLSIRLLEEAVIDIFHPLSTVLDQPIKELICINGEYFEIGNPTKIILEKVKELSETINWRFLLLNYCIPLSMKRLNIKTLPQATRKYIEKITIGNYGENLYKSLEQFYWEILPRFVGFEEMPWREYWRSPKNSYWDNESINTLHHSDTKSKAQDENYLLNFEIESISQNSLILSKIMYNNVVTDILFNSETSQVNVRVSDGTWYSSSCVISTLPIGVLKKSTQTSDNQNIDSNCSLSSSSPPLRNNRSCQTNKFLPSKNANGNGTCIKFTPSLPYETIRSLKLLEMSSYTEVYLELDDSHSKVKLDLWFSKIGDKIHHLDYPSLTFYTSKYTPNTVICGISPPLADKLVTNKESELTPQKLANICYGILNEISPKDVEFKLAKYFVKNWKDDPFSYGSIPIHSNDSKESNINQLIKPHYEGHLYFAGDGTTVDGFGSIKGALLSAKRVTTQVCQFLSN